MPNTYAVVNRHLMEARAACQAEIVRLTSDLESVRAKLRAIDEALAIGPDGQPHVDTESRAVARAPGLESLPQSTAQHESPDDGWVTKLEGLSQIKALVRIAEERGGVLRHAEATRILLEAGFIKGKRANAASHLYRLLKHSDQFEWVSPGTFRLVQEEDTSVPIDGVTPSAEDTQLALGPPRLPAA